MQTINMGDDDFILYIRKNNLGQGKTTQQLGRAIWVWMRKHIPGATKTIPNQQCRWGSSGSFVAADNLPKTSTQFLFDRSYLIALYDFIDTL